jgi:hypothetical protein
MLLSEIVKRLLVEKMTFSQLFRSSTPSRKQRAKDMRFVNRLPILAQKTDDYWDFRYKSGSSNNTTEESYRGRIAFLKPRKGKRWQIGIEKAKELENNNRFEIDKGLIKLKIYQFKTEKNITKHMMI